MKNYLKLVHFEIKRFWKLYAGLAAVIAIGQLVIVLYSTNHYESSVEKLRTTGRTVTEIIEKLGTMSLTDMTNIPLFLLTVFLGVTVLIIYMFFIWYRDWVGKNTFSYRLLMLPTNRMNIFFAKGTAIFMFIFGLLAMQIILLLAEDAIMRAVVSKEYILGTGIMSGFGDRMLAIMLPGTFTQFLIHYGCGLVVLITIFTAILLERSFRVRGVVMGIIYSIISALVLTLPSFIQSYARDYFYEKEMFLMELACSIIVGIVGLLISRYLLNRKITV